INLHRELEPFRAYLGVGMPDPVRRIVFPTLAREIRLQLNLLGKKIYGPLFVRIEPAMGADGALEETHQQSTVPFRPSSFNRQNRELIAGKIVLVIAEHVETLLL